MKYPNRQRQIFLNEGRVRQEFDVKRELGFESPPQLAMDIQLWLEPTLGNNCWLEFMEDEPLGDGGQSKSCLCFSHLCPHRA